MKIARSALVVWLACSSPLGAGADEIQKWQTPGGGLYFGEHPPAGSTLLGATGSLEAIDAGSGDDAIPMREAIPEPAMRVRPPVANPGDAPVTTGVSLAKRSRLYFDTWSQRGLSGSELEVIERNLNAVRNDVGRELGVDPDARLQVILTEPDVFHRYSGTRAHVSGMFDGKIHIPVPERIDERELQGTLWHEYAHAVIQAKTEGRCPVWLNEGIATYQEAKIDPQRKNLLGMLVKGRDTLPYSWDELDATLRSQTASPAAQAMAYLEAYAATAYLYERYRSQRVNVLLEALRTSDLPTALHDVLQTTPERLTTQIVDRLKGG